MVRSFRISFTARGFTVKMLHVLMRKERTVSALLGFPGGDVISVQKDFRSDADVERAAPFTAHHIHLLTDI